MIIHRFNYDDELGTPDDFKAPSELLKSHVAPKGDPDKHFQYEIEKQTAQWLRDSFRVTVLSVKRRVNGSSVDAYLPDLALTLELKHPESDSFLNLANHIVKGATQSRHVLVRSLVPYSKDIAEAALAKALKETGENLDFVLIKIGGGEFVVWSSGKSIH